jgi:hypothetical protein
MGLENIAEHLASKGFKLELDRSAASIAKDEGKSISELITERRKVFNVNKEVTQEVALDMFKGSRGPNAFYDDILAKRTADRVGRSIDQEQIKDNISNWRKNEQSFYDNRSNNISNNYFKTNESVMNSSVNNVGDIADYADAQDVYMNKYTTRHNDKMLKREQSAARIRASAQDEAIANEYAKAHGGGEKYSKKVADDSAGAAVTDATKDSSKLSQKMDGVLKKAVPIAVGGGLIFSMFNRGGQMSNSELYGQQPSYSGSGSY